ncbi:hypothetical protein DUI87_11484 [Hirundo rustica rustica]|uniref:Uncharacterized protein n=1 Tax=Hirundo rustica rustica TaxID=333673 RepID=A0A3M0KEC3_HIRRU|nr:hypothetical protein DUI87_11484 [Hirundo rustica rustica]
MAGSCAAPGRGGAGRAARPGEPALLEPEPAEPSPLRAASCPGALGSGWAAAPLIAMEKYKGKLVKYKPKKWMVRQGKNWLKLPCSMDCDWRHKIQLEASHFSTFISDLVEGAVL